MTNKKFKQPMMSENDIVRFAEKTVIDNLSKNLKTVADACSKVKEQVKL